MILRSLGGMLAVLVLSGCGGDAMLRCESTAAFESMTEHPPIRVPDDLSIPDQSDALRIPPPRGADAAVVPSDGPCLESPPDFYEGVEDSTATDGDPAPPS